MVTIDWTELALEDLPTDAQYPFFLANFEQ
jgi:hypothetical protein